MLLVAIPVRAAFWYQNYAEAEAAMESGDWNGAVALLEDALAQKGESGAQVRTYGMNFIRYFPYLKLGIARYNLQEHDAALLAFEAEERLGAIQESPEDFGALRSYRALTQQAKMDATAGQDERVVAQMLADADALAVRGDLDGAVTELGRADARYPDNPKIDEALARVRTLIAQRDAQLGLQQRVDDLVAKGRAKLEAGDLIGARTAVARANSLKSSAETQSLMDDITSQLTAVLEAQQDADRRAETISDGLRRASDLRTSGDFAQAIDALQAVLVLDPANSAAVQLQMELLQAQADADSEESVRLRVTSLLDAAATQFESGRLEESYATVNRVIAIDPANREALQRITAIYREFERLQLSPAELAKIPPLIRLPPFEDTQLEEHFLQHWRGRWPISENGRYVHWVSSDDFRLAGEVLALVAGKVTVIGPQGETHVEHAWQEFATSAQDVEGTYQRVQFSLRKELPPGLSVFRIRASNDNGGGVERTYAVFYEVPFVRSPWSYVVLGGVVVFLVLVNAGRRWNRRRQSFSRRFNPYIAGAPVLKDELFFGRERLLSRVLQSVHNNSILLYGERRIGKTSFQHHLRRRLEALKDPDYHFYPVFTDIQGTPEHKFFQTIAEDVFEQLGSHLDGVEPHESLHAESGYEYKHFVRDIRSVLKNLNSKNEKRIKVVLLIDEVDELNDYDPRVNQRLRALFMRSFAEDLVAVVSGVGIKKQWESEGSPWYNFFEEIQVEPFRKEDAEELIRRPIQGIFTADQSTIDRIVELGNCKPYLIQKLCISLVNRMYDEKRRHITVDDVDAVSKIREA